MNSPLKSVLLACSLFLQSELLLADSQSPRAAIDTTFEHFGKVDRGAMVSHHFALRNEGNAPLMIKRIEVSALGMKVRTKQQVAPGDSAKIQVSWDTSRYSGKVEEQVLLYLNDTSHPKVLLTLEGVVVPPIDILPIPALYMSQYKGEEKTRSLMVQNNQAHKIQITKVDSLGKHFIPRLETVEAGRTYRLWASVPSSTPVGRYRESVVLYTDDPDHPRLTVEVNILVKEDVHITPNLADFGAIQLSQMQLKPGLAHLTKQSFVIKRREGTMAITGVESDISFLNIGTIPSGQSEGFTLELALDFNQAVPGPFNGAIVLRTDDVEHPRIEIPVTGLIRE